MSDQEQPPLPFFQMKSGECSSAADSSFEEVVKDHLSQEEESSVCTTSTSASSHCEGEDDIRIHNNDVYQQSKAKVSLSFCPVVVKVEYHCQYEDIWTELLWYTSEDLEEIRRENAATVCHMTNGSIGLYADQYCSRGLEARTPAGAQRRLKHRQDSLEAVLHYPKAEPPHATTATKDSRVQDLAERYAQKTHGSMRIAQLMAMIDAKLVSAEAGRNITTSAFQTKPLRVDTNLAVHVQ